MRERTRDLDDYDKLMEYTRADRKRSVAGQVVVRGADVAWHQNRQALVKLYLVPSRHSGQPQTAALDDWRVFVQRVKVHSGKHRHQGGLVIYVIEGRGYTVVEGERHEWEAGDLLLLPLKAGGVEHQHFNLDPDQPVKWIAFVNASLKEWGASEFVQIEEHPDYRGR